MTHFARKLRYAAHDGDNGATYAALIELSNKKGGSPMGFVLFWRTFRYNSAGRGESKLIQLKAKTADEAIEKFWLSGKSFPGWKSDKWQKTTPWLDRVAVGGSYEQIPLLTWVRVGTPNLWAKRRKKKPLQFGNISHILLAHRLRLSTFTKDKSEIEDEISQLETWDDDLQEGYIAEAEMPAYQELKERVAAIEAEIATVEEEIEVTEAEMRTKVRQLFPKPIGKTPRREIRRQLEAAQHRRYL